MLTCLTVHDPLFCIAHHPVCDMLPVNVMNIHCSFCDALHWMDEHVSSSKIGHPDFRMCCAHEKVKLPPMWVPPHTLYNLFIEDTSQCRVPNKHCSV